MRPLIALALALAPLLAPCSARAGDLTVALTGIRAPTGVIRLALAGSAESYDGKAPPAQGTGAPPTGDTATFTFKDVAPGRYAVLVTHDENGNGRMDSNAIGMPLEGYGFSNNPNVMRKPTWDEASFEVGADGAAIAIELR